MPTLSSTTIFYLFLSAHAMIGVCISRLPQKPLAGGIVKLRTEAKSIALLGHTRHPRIALTG